jgi:hypothetical protein
MSEFFEAARTRHQVTHGSATYELPVRYHRDDAFALFFPADYGRVFQAMPSDLLHPIRLPGGKALVGIAAFNYIETSFGPYGEVAVFVPAVHGRRPLLPLLPGLLEARYPGFGNVVLHLPVTRADARDAGRGGWGYTKFVADMLFTLTPEALECRLGEGERHILTLHVARSGALARDDKPLISYTVRQGTLIKTTVAQRGVCKNQLLPKNSWLKLGDHPVSESIRELGIGGRPWMSRYYLERAAILPEGEPVEERVRALDGYLGTDGPGKLEVRYLGDGA